MEKKIFLPDGKQTAKLIENAWNDFMDRAREAGHVFDNDTLNLFLKDIFVAGYSYGYSDMLNLIRDQVDADHQIDMMMGD